MHNHFFIGVDGGATKVTVNIANSHGELIGSATAGPANIRLSVTTAWQSIYQAINKVLSKTTLSLDEPNIFFHVGMGLAGCEVFSAYQTFINMPHPFATLLVTSDADIACLGAHGGKDGAIISIGTGIVGLSRDKGERTKVGGWGFPHDDEGGGAWLGMKALRVTLEWLDGRRPMSKLAQRVYQFFAADQARLVAWANAATATVFAELAPFVIQAAQENDALAVSILKEAAGHVEKIAQTLEARRHAPALPCCLTGSIAPFLQPYLSEGLQLRLRPCQVTPVRGALVLISGQVKHSSSR
jgi:glucosamine kinase